ncbi:hypothetical protein BAUCODRAFT_144716 [Baudoinia panamericana UAMH 10762]|uniref:TeaA receptor TeaR n=1 Tax=Baudoinia panamericana (strain UAMH 10762) TaxID=717646 RepID=M2NAA9_BAUPA|nr:uncharacterized protein BAUCODRAFT_144716 [Baudoinia panamericana UAMH 10762]EMD01159.1 hypothetical protein BAUCODRAFT_144716 [Baudoinia panamericana UAMH 10762]
MATAVSGHWANAVPLDDSSAFSQQQRAETRRSQGSLMTGSAQSSSQHRQSDYNIMSDSEAAGSRRASIRASNASATRKRSRNQLKDKKPDKAEEYVDDSAWIHRDKLAQIEIQEMEEAGINVRSSRRSLSNGPGVARRSSRSASRPGAQRGMSRERRGEGELEGAGMLHSGVEDHQRKRVSTIPAAEEEEFEHDRSFDPNVDSEIRTQEEIAAERHSASKPHIIRPSTSRIPISRISTVPVPQDVVDRDSPLPRSRSGSGAWAGNWDEMQYARRARSSSIASQVLEDEVNGAHAVPRPDSSYMQDSSENSPPKARLPNKAKRTSAGRRTSGTANGNSRPNSGYQNKALTPQRPSSRTERRSRPSTSHAPEGEAPWIATMYKPDPRLPPDQQMLPTHAKRMMQDQWEKSGKSSTAYDRDFRPLNDQEFRQPPSKTPRLEHDPFPQPQPSPNGTLSLMKPEARMSPHTEGERPWPLTPAKSDSKSESGSTRPGTSGGYRITPTIAPPPNIQRPSTSGQNSALPRDGAQRVPDFDEKDVPYKKKGCACCVVM